MDAVFDSVSVATTFKEELARVGVLFMPISEAVREHPDLVKKYPSGDLYYGDFQNGFRHGQGTYMFSTGGKYRGIWIKGLINGECEQDFSFSGWNNGYCTTNERQEISFVSKDANRKKENKNKATELNKLIQSL